MKNILFLLFICCTTAFATKIPEQEITPAQVNRMFVYSTSIDVFDFNDRSEKIESCIEDYKNKQSKSYMRVAQGNLFDLIHNFDNLVSKLYGKRGLKDTVSYDEKIALLAKLQCDTYYKMGVLK